LDPNEKRKCKETDIHGDIDNHKMFETIVIFDDKENIVNKRLRQTVGHDKVQNNPTLPEERTSTTNFERS